MAATLDMPSVDSLAQDSGPIDSPAPLPVSNQPAVPKRAFRSLFSPIDAASPPFEDDGEEEVGVEQNTEEEVEEEGTMMVFKVWTVTENLGYF
ncbi:hypothetical protein V5O48_010184 [Marasmius crinis-equi]|uniref:Uncharacterized protein n=1 Tax=Marasmius crinis-equi TaxID=585013 RepID=A0ABR3F9K4_9AGAR